MVKGLGRGFDTLITGSVDPGLFVANDEKVQKIPVASIMPNPDQPRKEFNEEALLELASSIKQYGVLQPLIVTQQKTGGYTLIAGERRLRAAQTAELERVPAIVRSDKRLERLEIALMENVQRVDLSPLEQAVSIKQLHDEFSMSFGDIAVRLGKAESTVNNLVRLLALPSKAQEALQKGVISEGHARSILALKNLPKKQTELLQMIQEHGWSVRQAEQFVTNIRGGAGTAKKAVNKMAKTTYETKLIAKNLGTSVTIKHLAKGGKLEIHFSSDEQLKKIYKKMANL